LFIVFSATEGRGRGSRNKSLSRREEKKKGREEID